MTQTLMPPSADHDHDRQPGSAPRTLLGRITRAEVLIGAALAAIMVVLVAIEPSIIEAPFQNANTIAFTLGGTLFAAAAFALMLRRRVAPVMRIVVLVVPFVVVNWWLLSPYFLDDVVDEEFSTSIAAQVADTGQPATDAPATDAPATDAPATDEAAGQPANDAATTPAADEQPAATTPPATAPVAEEPPATAPPSGPVLLGAGSFVGLAGHDGTGDAGIFRDPDGSLLLRFENFDIENGPDLEVYLVPGADQVGLADGSIHLGALKGNVGDQGYELPAGTDLGSGTWTALVWCEAFSVEFVGANLDI